MVESIIQVMEEQLREQEQDALALRQSVSKLRQMLKEGDSLPEGKEAILISCLQAQDAKTRKNTALLLGDLALPVFLEPLFAAYGKETQMFVRSAYLKAIGAFDYRAYLSWLKERLQELAKETPAEENRKHIMEEMRVLSELIVTMEGTKKHRFVGFTQPSEVIILANRRQLEVTERQIPDRDKQSFAAGIRVKSERLDRLCAIRTYQELLFILPDIRSCEADISVIAQQIAGSSLLHFLEVRHEGEAPFYFRIELKGRMALDKKSSFVKRLATQIETLTDRVLINSTSSYEFEIRLIENKENKYNILLKLYTIPDERFAYRKEAVASSIKPVNAALLTELAKPFMKEDAQVLDPFCGVGTMLLERQKAVKANTSYGIDKQEEAIEKAKRNTEAAGQIIHYVHKDFFDFTHEYLFDEIFTDMPFAMGHITETEIKDLYRHFFDKAKELLQENGTLILYTHNKELIEQYAPKKGYTVLKRYEIMTKEGTWLYLLRTSPAPFAPKAPF